MVTNIEPRTNIDQLLFFDFVITESLSKTRKNNAQSRDKPQVSPRRMPLDALLNKKSLTHMFLTMKESQTQRNAMKDYVIG